METEAADQVPAMLESGPQPHFDARLIPEFDSSTGVVEWLMLAEMSCRLHGVAVETVLPSRLSGGAFTVWAQLPTGSQSPLETMRNVLHAAFALDEHAAGEAFSARRLQPGESADVYLADLLGGVPDRPLGYTFVAGLPDSDPHRLPCRGTGPGRYSGARSCGVGQ